MVAGIIRDVLDLESRGKSSHLTHSYEKKINEHLLRQSRSKNTTRGMLSGILNLYGRPERCTGLKSKHKQNLRVLKLELP